MRAPRSSFIRLLAAGVVAVWPAVLAQEVSKPATNYSLTVRADKPEAIYRRGEEVRFKVKLLLDRQPVKEGMIEWTLSQDGIPPIRQGQLSLADGEGTVTGTLERPGFLQCRVAFKTPAGATISALGGAGIDPLEIKPSLPVPEDFDAFWDAQKRKLAQVPMNPRLTPVEARTDGIESFDLQADCVGAPVSGYYSRPAGAKPKSLPAYLSVHGAGVRSSDLGTTVTWAKEGFLALDINAHGIPNGKPAAYYTDLANGELKDYRTRGRESRETVYFLGMFLRLVRAMDFLAAQPEWDGRTLVVRGSSQGGAQAIAAAGLDSRVSFFAAGVPALCDHTATVVGRVCGWPKLVPVAADGKPDAAILEVARYYDAVNFAARAKAPAIFTVGFIDTTCPPSSVYAAYNALRSPKTIYNDVLSKHENTPGAMAAMREAILRHAGK